MSKTPVAKGGKKSETPVQLFLGPDISLSELLEAGVHFGHQAKRWHPKMAPFLWQSRGGVHIFDLLVTKDYLAKACMAAAKIVGDGGKIVFVGSKRQAQEIVAEEAKRCGMPYVSQRWAGGLLTNWKQVKKSIDKMNSLKKGLETGEFKKLTKKERLLIDRRVAQLERLFGGLSGLTEIPQAIFVVDVNREKTAVAEAKVMGVKIFAVVDSNVDPEPVDYPIPGNDDAVGSIKLLVSALATAVIKGKAKTGKKQTEGEKDEA